MSDTIEFLKTCFYVIYSLVSSTILNILFIILAFILYEIFEISLLVLILLGFVYFIILIHLSVLYDDPDSCGYHPFMTMVINHIFILMLMFTAWASLWAIDVFG